MTTLNPRAPYTDEELQKLYPKGLELQLVQVFLRHGERTPVSVRFQNAGLHPYWPYCNAARRMISMAASSQDLSSWDTFHWQRRMEGFGVNDAPRVATGPSGEVDGICQHGELTDKGRETTHALGERLRTLYVDQLGFLPAVISHTDNMYLRTTPIPRALESLQQTFRGMYPSNARTVNLPPPSIVTRSATEETLFPNEGGCQRFRQLARLFAQRAADRWNDSEEMGYLNSKWGKWMPANSPVAVDSRPRLSGILDTINSTMAHGPKTRLPSEFYDAKARETADKIATEEWFAGSYESQEYRKLAIGPLLGDVVERMVHTVVNSGWRPTNGAMQGESPVVNFAMSGCHDTTLATILSSLGTFRGEKWPPYTSSIAIELFKDTNGSGYAPGSPTGTMLEEFAGPSPGPAKSSFLSFFSRGGSKNGSDVSSQQPARAPLSSLPPLSKHYVRIRYNDQAVRIPGCAAKPNNHLPGDDTFCTLDAFKEIVDKFTPADWIAECGMNTDKGMFAEGEEKAGGY